MGGNLSSTVEEDKNIAVQALSKDSQWVLDTNDLLEIRGRTKGPVRQLEFIRSDERQSFFDERQSECEFKWRFKGYKGTEIVFSCRTHLHGDSIDDAIADTPVASIKGTYIPVDAHLREYVIQKGSHIFLFVSKTEKLFWIDVKISKG